MFYLNADLEKISLNFSVAPEKNKKITSLMKKADKATSYRKTCGYLTESELIEYLTMFPNPEELFKAIFNFHIFRFVLSCLLHTVMPLY